MRPPLITGENLRIPSGWTLPVTSFNEAPADHGGKRDREALYSQAGGKASMRPPLITGENLCLQAPTTIFSGASMRPPLITGENVLVRLL